MAIAGVVTYLVVVTNNQAETAFRAFQTGVEEYGVPSRVCTDKGGENVQIAEFMITQRGSNRGSIITRRTVHNQRIEQLWRDVFTDSIIFFFIYCFTPWSHTGVLDQSDSRDLYVMHLVFLPKIQLLLNQFRLGWNHHKLRTEYNKSPYQLWITGMSRHDLLSNVLCNLYIRPYDRDYSMKVK